METKDLLQEQREEQKHICCVILAAGLSSRMGKFKPLLPIQGRPAILFLLDKLFQSGVSTCVIVTGHNAGLLKEACAEYEQIIWGHNPDYASTGMWESAKIGFSLVPEGCSRVLLTPVDIPLVKKETISRLCSADDPLLFPSFRFRKGHPAAIDGEYLPFLLQYDGTDGLRGAFAALPVEPSYMVTDDAFVLMDMDTPEDYDRLLKQLEDDTPAEG